MGLRTKDEALLQAVLEEREEAKEGEGDEMKGDCPAAHRELVERIKKSQGKQEEAMESTVVEALGLSWLRFAKAEDEAEADKPHSTEAEMYHSSPSDGIQQKISRAEEESLDGSLGIASDGREENVGKDEEHV
ncbi:uncharacterized protein MONOS_7711 [Monocercomonoides exilis]|uniref:uncharacterized protein n=1 Tax=Monocercomonoides exilis TaxID=2049356 RepID=UPI003559DFF5|nr:hypothetical protein MONOS_7711 [Monocercomonoides exilis]|eukprot:MONOS_7711.1-p1 / transcript=MONOS_7711.1 / gene=MONOS_7711 / organism=Monocercomonoides_exilis_PA203 / gene_product=unspecified product / transcript_product=unspecified product / location=Mono_scaffold00270:62179-62577(-) / protein_length=133 / sequence_SO=supercontig / SO=protein_coding / is_pseudo=false